MKLSENKLRENIKKMKPGSTLCYNNITLLIDSIKELQKEKVYVLRLFDANKKCIRNGPTILTKPKKQRRAVSPIIATIILVGISIAVAAIFTTSMSASSDTIHQNISCQLINIKLYKISSTSQAYFIVKLQNTGNTIITDAYITFLDDSDTEYGFNENLLTLGTGQNIDKEGTFAAIITKNNPYLIDANISGEDGSQSSCITVVSAR